MAFQISIGDGLMLSRLAFDIAQAFTSGRKSAPAEFQEVQNQLYSLSKALDSFKFLSSTDPGPVHETSAIIQNCRFTLEHLELLVNKYMVIQDDSKGHYSRKKQWRAEIWKNWRKVQWTREGGDLAKLQHNLGVHINSLNLAVAVMNRWVFLIFIFLSLLKHPSESHQKMGSQVDDVHEMLGEIYNWFTSNLKGRTTSFYEPSPTPSRPQTDMSLGLTFSLQMESAHSHDIAICENACFDPEWLRASTEQRVFKCQCPAVHGGMHDRDLSQYSCMSASPSYIENELIVQCPPWVSSSA
jgi:hypothetical protein